MSLSKKARIEKLLQEIEEARAEIMDIDEDPSGEDVKRIDALKALIQESYEEIENIDPDFDSDVYELKKQQKRMQELKDKKPSTKFILNPAELPQIIDHAVGGIEIDKKKLRYYGAKLPEKVTKINRKGIPYTVTMKVSALILENGELISEYTKPENLDFAFDSEMTMKHNRWSLNSIRKFHDGKYKKHDVSFKVVFDSFKQKYDKGMVFECDEWYATNALWDMCTYFWDLIDKFLILKHEGITGAAKSKGMKISANLSFNGKKFLCPTPATFFRYRHHNKATICIEEAEKLFDDSRKKNVGDSLLVEYLNGSYEKGNTVPRQDDKNLDQTNEFDPAGYTRIGAIKPLKGALRGRSVPLDMVKARKSDERGEVEVPSPYDSDYSETRDLAYVNGLLNWQIYEKALREIKNTTKIANREWLMSKPLIAMAQCVDPDMVPRIIAFLESLFEQKDPVFSTESWEVVLSEVLVNITSTEADAFFLDNESLRTEFIAHMNQNSAHGYNISQHKITKMMGSVGFGRFKGLNSTGTKRGYKNMHFYDVIAILIRNELLTINYILQLVQIKVSELSECKFTVDEIMKWYTDTFSDTYTSDANISDTLTDTYTFLGGGGKKNQQLEIKNSSVLDDTETAILAELSKNNPTHTDSLLAKTKLEERELMAKLEAMRKRGDLIESKPDQWLKL